MFSIKLSNPEKSQVVIFDPERTEIVERAIFEGIDHKVLHARYELFYITPHILFLMLMNIRHIQIIPRKGMSVWRNLVKCSGNLMGSLYRIYLLSCIQYMEPKVIVTYIDNSYAFQFISRRYKKGYFLAIQNGNRCAGNLRDWLPPYPEPASVISMPVLCCFGNYERDLYKKFDHSVDVFYPIGSLRAGYYKSQKAVEDQKKEFDLCLISERENNQAMERELPPECSIGANNLDAFLKRYLQERKLKFCIALRSTHPDEEEYFIGQYGSQAHLVKSDKKNFSPYRAVDESSVVVAFSSTLAREAFGWGAKVLFCNFTGDDLYTFPCPGFWSITELDYDLFKDRLDYIFSISEKEYRSQTRESAAYVMNYDPEKSPHEFIKELILKQKNS
jgi:surface carbohydrate biosynthesis protein